MGVGGQRHGPAALPPGMTRYPLCCMMCILLYFLLVSILNVSHICDKVESNKQRRGEEGELNKTNEITNDSERKKNELKDE